MTEFIITLGLGLLVCILGIINMTGNLSTLHWYHRKRVREEDRKTFGKLVGLGTLMIGISLLAFAVLTMVSEHAQLNILVVIGSIELLIGVVVGIAISFYAMIKYNKGIF